MKHHDAQPSPQIYARMGGALRLIIMAIGLFGQAFVRGRLIISGDATATADKLRSAEVLWRASTAGEVVVLSCAVTLAVLFYVLLRPVNRDLALLAVFLNLVSNTLAVANRLHLLAALFPLEKVEHLQVFSPGQLHALATLSLKAHEYGFGVDLIFFGIECLILGYLIHQSGYLPRALGVLMAIAGLCYLTNSFAMILSPALADRIFPALMLPVFVVENSLAVWLLMRGVNASKWQAWAGAASPPGVLAGA